MLTAAAEVAVPSGT